MSRKDFIYCLAILGDHKVYTYKPAKYCNVRGKTVPPEYKMLYHELKRIYKAHLIFQNENRNPSTPGFQKVFDNGELQNCVDVFEKIRTV